MTTLNIWKNKNTNELVIFEKETRAAVNFTYIASGIQGALLSAEFYSEFEKIK